MHLDPLITIPRGLACKPCPSCGQPIYWAPDPESGRAHPVSVDYDIAPSCRRPTGHMDGAGISHRVICEGKPAPTEQPA
jgi:hypothetical protein